MGDLVLKGAPLLNLKGLLKLAASGGKVKAGLLEVLVEGAKGVGTAPVPIVVPPSPFPLDPGLTVAVTVSFNQTVTAGGKAIVVLGMCFQGDLSSPGPWPGIVQPSVGNQTVMANGIPMNVLGDQATILPTGAAALFSTDSGQK